MLPSLQVLVENLAQDGHLTSLLSILPCGLVLPNRTHKGLPSNSPFISTSNSATTFSPSSLIPAEWESCPCTVDSPSFGAPPGYIISWLVKMYVLGNDTRMEDHVPSTILSYLYDLAHSEGAFPFLPLLSCHPLVLESENHAPTSTSASRRLFVIPSGGFVNGTSRKRRKLDGFWGDLEAFNQQQIILSAPARDGINRKGSNTTLNNAGSIYSTDPHVVVRRQHFLAYLNLVLQLVESEQEDMPEYPKCTQHPVLLHIFGDRGSSSLPADFKSHYSLFIQTLMTTGPLPDEMLDLVARFTSCTIRHAMAGFLDMIECCRAISHAIKDLPFDRRMLFLQHLSHPKARYHLLDVYQCSFCVFPRDVPRYTSGPLSLSKLIYCHFKSVNVKNRHSPEEHILLILEMVMAYGESQALGLESPASTPNSSRSASPIGGNHDDGLESKNVAQSVGIWKGEDASLAPTLVVALNDCVDRLLGRKDKGEDTSTLRLAVTSALEQVLIFLEECSRLGQVFG